MNENIRKGKNDHIGHQVAERLVAEFGLTYNEAYLIAQTIDHKDVRKYAEIYAELCRLSDDKRTCKEKYGDLYVSPAVMEDLANWGVS